MSHSCLWWQYLPYPQSLASAIQAARSQVAAQKSRIGEESKRREENDEEGAKDEKKRKKHQKQKKKHKALESSTGSRFQQQQLPFLKSDPVNAATKDKTEEEEKDLKRVQESELSRSKRTSLDTMSRRTAHSTSTEVHMNGASSHGSLLKHKKPRFLSPKRVPRSPVSKARHHSLDSEKRVSKESSKYFAQKQHKKPQRKSSLIHFVDQIEEKKSSQKTTLDEYLALDRKQKDLIEEMQGPKKKEDANTGSSKWDRDREQFRSKHQQQLGNLKLSSASMGNWLKSGKQEEGKASSSSKHRRSSMESHGKKSPIQQAQPRSFELHRATRPKAPGSTDLDFSMATEHTSSMRRRKAADSDKARDPKYVKRKRSSDFSSSPVRVPSNTSKHHDKPNLTNTWMSKRR